MHSVLESLNRHSEVRRRDLTLRKLVRSFEFGADDRAFRRFGVGEPGYRLRSPHSSTRKLLIKMGPFETARHAFAFTNNFGMTADQFEKLRVFVLKEATDAILEDIVLKPVRDVLKAIRVTIPDIPVPGPLPDIPIPDITIPDILIEDVIRIVTGPALRLVDFIVAAGPNSGYGRCGGMAFAGYDFYRFDWRVDQAIKTTPTRGVLGNYIFDRLVDSLDVNMGTFVEWLITLHVMPKVGDLADAALQSVAYASGLGYIIEKLGGGEIDVFDLGGPRALNARSRREWSLLKDVLDRQAAVPLGLIYDNKMSPFDQHQVLAIGYSETGTNRGSVRIWDNNKPREKQLRYKLDFTGDRLVSDVDGLVGFFVENYSERRPPDTLRLD
jgi:hypothetical protein